MICEGSTGLDSGSETAAFKATNFCVVLFLDAWLARV